MKFNMCENLISLKCIRHHGLIKEITYFLSNISRFTVNQIRINIKSWEKNKIKIIRNLNKIFLTYSFSINFWFQNFNMLTSMLRMELSGSLEVIILPIEKLKSLLYYFLADCSNWFESNIVLPYFYQLVIKYVSRFLSYL